MLITRKLSIHEVKGTGFRDALYHILLRDNSTEQEVASSLMLDKDTCARHNLPMSFDLIGQTLVCSFESRELPLSEGRVDERSLESNDLQIRSLKKSEVVSPFPEIIPPKKHVEVSRTLEISSFDWGGGSLHMVPCPFYELVLELTDEEYEECKALPPTAIFKMNFRLA